MLWTVLIGLVVGGLARWIKPGEQAIGWIMTALIGVGGAIVLLVGYEAIKPRLTRGEPPAER